MPFHASFGGRVKSGTVAHPTDGCKWRPRARRGDRGARPRGRVRATRCPRAAAAAIPLAKTAPSGPTSSTASPGSKRPSHATTPTASRLRPSTATARRAPSSTRSRPFGGFPKRSQSLYADSSRSAPWNRVPRGSPSRIGSSTASPVASGDDRGDAGGRGHPRGEHLAPIPPRPRRDGSPKTALARSRRRRRARLPVSRACGCTRRRPR